MRKDVVFKMFKAKVKFVKPLYKKSRHIDKDKILAINFDSSIDLRGDGVYMNKNVSTERAINKNIKCKLNKSECVALPGVCESDLNNVPCYNFDRLGKSCYDKKTTQRDNYTTVEFGNKRKYSKMLKSEKNKFKHEEEGPKTNVRNGIDTKEIVLHKVTDAWLRVYPAPRKPDESVSSIVIRCVFCQLGLAAILVIWNIIWVFVINSFEGPEEIKVTKDFEKEQTQLVIDLATELRQITPLSNTWREAIEKRLEDARKLTVIAVGKGAKIKPGFFWDLPGTFLFSVYVMTALGFGAPVPHTVWGRMAALIYSVLAVPTHIYLMWNASICTVVQIEQNTESLKRKYGLKKIPPLEQSNVENFKGIPFYLSCSRIMYLSESSTYDVKSVMLKKPIHCNKYLVMLVIFCSAHRIALLITVYYTLGVVLFGVVRDRMPLEAIMFPLEFTTTGGLEEVKCHVRVLYGLYVEGAMFLLACALANARRISSSPVACMSETYRLFHSADCSRCNEYHRQPKD